MTAPRMVLMLAKNTGPVPNPWPLGLSEAWVGSVMQIRGGRRRIKVAWAVSEPQWRIPSPMLGR